MNHIMWDSHRAEYYLAIKNSGFLIRAVMGEPQKHDAKGRQPDGKDYRLQNSIYVKCLGKINP